LEQILFWDLHYLSQKRTQEAFIDTLESFVGIWNEFDSSFISYFEKQWIEAFPPATWALFRRLEAFGHLKEDMWVQTNNKIENWHRTFKQEKMRVTIDPNRGLPLHTLVALLLREFVVSIGREKYETPKRNPKKKEGKETFHTKLKNIFKIEKKSQPKGKEPLQRIKQIKEYHLSKKVALQMATYGEKGISNSCRFDSFLTLFVSIFHTLPLMRGGEKDSNLVAAMRKLPEIIKNQDFGKAKRILSEATENDPGLGEMGHFENFLSSMRSPDFFTKITREGHCHQCNLKTERIYEKVVLIVLLPLKKGSNLTNKIELHRSARPAVACLSKCPKISGFLLGGRDHSMPMRKGVPGNEKNNIPRVFGTSF